MVVKIRNMIRLIDYTFFRIAFFFDQISSVGIINSISIISIIQAWNLLAINNLLSRITKTEFTHSLLSLFIVCIVLITLNSIRYLKFKKYSDLYFLWKDEERNIRAKRGFLILTYILLSLVLYIVI